MNRMAKTRSIALSILALALVAAIVTLWPLAAGAGLTYGAAAPGLDIPANDETYHPQVGSAPVAQLARYWGTPAANSAYAYDETLGVELVFSEAVTVTGVPYLELQIGAAVKKANYHEGSGTATLRFQYRVADGDRDTDGFSINGASALKLNGGTIKSVAAPSRDAYTASLPVTVHGSVRNDAGHKVHGENLAPTFGSATVASQVYPPNQLIPVLDLPAATGGNGALTYSLNQTTGAPPCGTGGVSGSSGNSGVGGRSGNAIPAWMRYYAPGTTYNGATVGGGGKIAPNGANKPTTTMSPACFELYAVDADGDNSATDRAVLSFSVAAHIDYDSNDNGLIEVASLAQLDAIRYDLNGNGAADNTADDAKYATAFPHSAAGMGCQLADHDANAATPNIPVCAGYELTQNLDFDTDGDGATYTVSSSGVVTGDAGDAYYNGGQGWTPIGSGPSSANQFAATFDGKDKTISKLFINRTGTPGNIGLFGDIGAAGVVQNLGLLEVSVSNTAGGATGSLAGRNHGMVTNCYATGFVATTVPDGKAITTGGLVAYIRFGGKVTSSYAAVAVSSKYASVTDTVGRNRIGGLAGRITRSDSAVIASYSTGPVTVGARDQAGALVGTITVLRGIIIASYATGPVTRNGSAFGNMVTQYISMVTDSYWDKGRVGAPDSSNPRGKTTRELQSPDGYTGIYANWNVDVDNADGDNNTATGVDDPWDFGTSRQYPVLKHGGLDPAQQRRVSIQSDNWNAPVVGEPVTASLNVDGAAGAAWQWQSSTYGAAWTNIAGATGTTYVPVAADAASGGKFLRAKVTFTASGKSQTLATVNTAKVIAASTATTVTDAVAFVPDVTVGTALEYAVSGTGTTDHFWRWQRCANKEMTSGCAYIGDGVAAYRIAAADVGKYLRAYVYYADGSAWKRTTTPVLGPVVAAPAPPASDPTPTPTTPDSSPAP